MTQLAAAIRGMNGSKLLPPGREFRLRRRAPGKRPIVDLVDLETGEVLDELSPEQLIRLIADLDQEQGRRQ
jgi:uncharacterized FlaG/YvyC family protein